MRPRSAVAVWAAALALGGTAGLVAPPLDDVLPVGPAAPSAAASTSGPGSPAPGASSPTPVAPVTPSASPSTSASPSASASPSPSPSQPPPTRADLLSVRSFAQVLTAVVDASPAKPDRSIDATSCVSDDVHATATLKKITGHDPVLEGDWQEVDDGTTNRQLVAVADDEEDARESVTRLAISMQACEEATPGHFVVGQPSTHNFSPTRSGTSVGYYPDSLNRSGRAPTDVEPCGGTVLARNGTRFTTVVVDSCLDGAQLAELADTASERLG